MAESIRGKVIRDLIARFSNDLLIGKKIKSGELRKRAVDLEPEWKCPEQFTNTMILMENFTMELLEPGWKMWAAGWCCSFMEADILPR